MKWLGTVEIETQPGVWYAFSCVCDRQIDAWRWAEKRAFKAQRQGQRTRYIKAIQFQHRRIEAGQFDFLRGNEACAREWQDGSRL